MRCERHSYAASAEVEQSQREVDHLLIWRLAFQRNLISRSAEARVEKYICRHTVRSMDIYSRNSGNIHLYSINEYPKLNVVRCVALWLIALLHQYRLYLENPTLNVCKYYAVTHWVSMVVICFVMIWISSLKLPSSSTYCFSCDSISSSVLVITSRTFSSTSCNHNFKL